jgi:phosphate transport system protein
MTFLFDENIEQIKGKLHAMAALVEKAVIEAANALFTADVVSAEMVIERDKAVNSFEIDIDAESYKYMALHAPSADQVRWLLSAQKVNATLERIGDHAVNIAESAIDLSSGRAPGNFLELPHMADLVKAALHDALASFFDMNPALAEDILTRDDAVDRLNAAMTNSVREFVITGDESFSSALDLIRTSRNLERIADLSTNIAEEAIFCTESRIVKHHSNEQIADLSLGGMENIAGAVAAERI